MKVGIPKGLLHYKYKAFTTTFFQELGADIITSPDTNKLIMNEGVKYCVDEACLPIKIFHGHVASIKDKCDLIIIPRFMKVRKNEYICPKFCGLPEMIFHSIPDLPTITDFPLYLNSEKGIAKWAKKAGLMVTKDTIKISKAFLKAKIAQSKFDIRINNMTNNVNVALLGHPYNIYDNYMNMNIINKLKNFNVGVVSEEIVTKEDIDKEISSLFKTPFWSFASNAYGAASYFYDKKIVDGIIYISSFACGIDSVVVELIKDKLNDFPLLILKIDEQTGEGGFNTRIEAFIDMLERRKNFEGNLSSHG